MHTNIDKTHLNKYFVEKILGLKLKEFKEFISYCECKYEF